MNMKMKMFYGVAKRLQSFDRLLPPSWRVPFRYFASKKVFGGLEPEMRLLSELASRGGIAIDVGANRGTYTYALAGLCHRVIAFEPIPDCARPLKAWAMGRNVDVHECALGEQSGELILHLPIVGGALVTTRASLIDSESQAVKLTVQVRRLDDFGLENICFIKIDVEGFELAVLKGAARVLRELRPNLLVEIDPAQQAESFRATFDWLASQGYLAHYLDGDRLCRCGVDIRRSRPDIYNFVFLPAEGAEISRRTSVVVAQTL